MNDMHGRSPAARAIWFALLAAAVAAVVIGLIVALDLALHCLLALAGAR